MDGNYSYNHIISMLFLTRHDKDEIYVKFIAANLKDFVNISLLILSFLVGRK